MRASVSWSRTPVRGAANRADNPSLRSRSARARASPLADPRVSPYEITGSEHSAVQRKVGCAGRRASAASRFLRCASTSASTWLDAIQYSVQRRGGSSRTRRPATRCLPTSTSIWNSPPPARHSGTQTSPARLAPSGSRPAVPTSVPRRSVTRARAAGESRPVTAIRTRLLRPSGGWYNAVGVASITTDRAGLRALRRSSDRAPSHATKLRRSVMAA